MVNNLNSVNADANSKSFFELKSPHTDEVITEVQLLTEQEIQQLIDRAYEAQREMKELPAHKKSEILEKLADLLSFRREEAAKLIALEASKPLKFAREEVTRTIETYKFAAEEAKRIQGETLSLDAVPSGEGKIAYTLKEPVGVIAAITPFNFPMNLVAHKIGPAIAAGNSILLKPASQTPLSAYFIADLLEEAGLPSGALSVISGSGRLVGDLLVKSDKINMVTFTGSPAIGQEIKRNAGLKKVTLELGSNSALIVDNHINIEKIIDRCIKGAFSNQGQVCISLQRIYVHEALYDDFVSQFIEATQQLKIGNPLEEDTDIAAMISKNELTRVVDWIEEAKSLGAEIALGNQVVGNVLMPTIILEAPANAKVLCEEAFAPIVTINKITTVDEGIQAVNDSCYGLQAGIYTNDIQTALRATKQLEVGGVLINDIPTFRVDHMPYGGVKNSGIGREGIKYSIEEMTELKLVIWNQS